jgi:hypothetical protein
MHKRLLLPTLTARAGLLVLVAVLVSGCDSFMPTPEPSASPQRPLIAGERPYFQRADWLWGTIPSTPVLDEYSAAIVAALADPTAQRVTNVVRYAVSLRGSHEVTASTPRVNVSFEMVPRWGPHPLFNHSMPFVRGTPIPTGSDAQYAVADPTTNRVYSVYKVRGISDSEMDARWGGSAALDGEGIEEWPGGSTGSGVSRYAGVVRIEDMARGYIPHALFFSTDIAQGPNNTDNFRYPARKTDGKLDPAPHTLVHGTRIQLDPTIDLDAIPGITEAEKVIGRALQKYGAYSLDNGGARMAFIFELERDGSLSQVYRDMGITRDYFNLKNIPWDRLRVLAQWDGGGKGTVSDPEPAPEPTVRRIRCFPWSRLDTNCSRN